MKTTTPGISQTTILRREDSELVLEVGPLAIFRGSSLEYKDQRREIEPVIHPYYTIAINPNWLDAGGEVELCIKGDFRISGSDKPLAEEEDLLVQIKEAEGKYDLLVMDDNGHMSTHLQLERVPDPET